MSVFLFSAFINLPSHQNIIDCYGVCLDFAPTAEDDPTAALVFPLYDYITLENLTGLTRALLLEQ